MLLDLRYAAGLFDGEGWFQIDRSKKRECRYPSYQVHARITMRDKILIEGLQETFAGSVRTILKKSILHATYYGWDVCGENALRFALLLKDHLIIKKRQADLAIEFQLFKRQNRNQPQTQSRLMELTRMYSEMKELNTKGRDHA